MRKKDFFFVYIKKKMNSVCVKIMFSFLDYVILATVFLIVTYRYNYWDQLYYIGKHYRVKEEEGLGLNSEKWKSKYIFGRGRRNSGV